MSATHVHPQTTTACLVKRGSVGGLLLGQDWEDQTPLGGVWRVSDASKQDLCSDPSWSSTGGIRLLRAVS